jgi:hypothetical protein
MDDIKVAFETIIVGVLAVPWLTILFLGLMALFDAYARSNPLRDIVERARGEHGLDERAMKLAGVFLIAAAYFIGAGISRLADYTTGLNFTSRVLYPLGVKSDGCIRMQTYLRSYKNEKIALVEADFPLRFSVPLARLRAALDSSISCLGPRADILKDQVIKPIYTFQKFRVYNSSQNGFETLHHIDSEMVVLRGGFLNGLILCFVCLPYLIASLLMQIRAFVLHPRGSHNWRPGKPTTYYIALFTLGLALTAMGRAAWQAVEEHYDDRVIGLYSTLDRRIPEDMQ